MRRILPEPGRSGLCARAVLLLALAGLLVAVPPLRAQTNLVITNLAQLSQLTARRSPVIADARLQATVFACDTNTGTVVLQDGSGAELLEVEGLRTEFNPGDVINLEGSHLFFSADDFGVYVSTAPLINNDGVHGPRTLSAEYSLTAGRHPVRVDWFNQELGEDLAVWFTPSASSASMNADGMATNLLHAEQATCYEGNWFALPNFQLLVPVKSGAVTNFDLGFRTRDDLVGIRFEGYLDVPAAGAYAVHLRSDDGGRLWIGDVAAPVQRIGAGSPPAAVPAMIGEAAVNSSGATGRRLATVEGRVSFASRLGKGLRVELESEEGSMSVLLANAKNVDPAELLEASVRVSGVAGYVQTVSGRAVLGAMAAADAGELTVLEKSPDQGEPPAVLKTVAQMRNLSSNEIARGLPVEIRGVVTAFAQGINYWVAVQDNTRGSFVELPAGFERLPRVGELWSIRGHTRPGGFAPVIVAERAALLGRGRMPEPAHPTWSQLANGSMDVQWVELEGVATGASGSQLTLLLPEGRQSIDMVGWGEAELRALDKARVRIRGALFAAWDSATHEAIVGNITIYNGAVSIENAAPKDPFDAPEKTPRGLFRFDARAASLQQVKVAGQVTYADSQRLVLEADAGIEVYPEIPAEVKAGDWVEAVGYPVLYDTGPQLHGALLRKRADGMLPAAPVVSDALLPVDKFALRRIRIQGALAGLRVDADTAVMQIQTHSNLLVAHVADGASLGDLRVGSKLMLTAVCVSTAGRTGPSSDAGRFELLVNSPADVAVLSAPSWWTLQRLLSVVAVLVITLALAAVWIAVLRRQVMQRSLRLRKEIREREHAERQHAVEAERSRIARDLHDELGSGLTEMSLLASAGLEDENRTPQSGERLQRIAERARTLVLGLDVIVWAIDPRRNSVQSFVDYVECYAEELLSASGIHCRFKIPVECRAATLSGPTRHSLLLAVKEALTNVIRHAAATEVELQVAQPEDRLEIIITDNGRGFDMTSARPGDGLRNLRERMSALSGKCRIESVPGQGARISLVVPLRDRAAVAEAPTAEIFR